MAGMRVTEPPEKEFACPFCFPKIWLTSVLCSLPDVNPVTSDNLWTRPRVHECIKYPRDVLVFCTLETYVGYCQVQIEDADCNNTASTPNYKFHQFSCLPIRPWIAPWTFQKTTAVIISLVKSWLALLYLGDTITFLQAAQGHIRQVRTVLLHLHVEAVTLILEKCSFYEGIDYTLGHVLRSARLALTFNRTEMTHDLKVLPTVVSELKSFNALLSVY